LEIFWRTNVSKRNEEIERSSEKCLSGKDFVKSVQVFDTYDKKHLGAVEFLFDFKEPANQLPLFHKE
jgi:hypothetical protein